MKKFIHTFLIIILLFSISACSQNYDNPYEIIDSSEQIGIGYPIYNPVFPQNYTEGNMYNDILEYEDNNVYFKVMHLYLPDIYTEGDDFRGISWYAFQIITSDEYEISFTCGDSYHTIETNKSGYNNISDNIVLSYQTGSTITVTLKNTSEVVYTSSFEYISDTNQIDQDDYQFYIKDEFQYFNFLYIVLGVIVLFFASALIYRKYYTNSLNNNLKDNKKVKMLDLNKFVVFSGCIFLLLSLGTGYIWKHTYEAKAFNNVSLTRTIVLMDGTTLEDLDIDYDSLVLDEVEIRVSEGELIRYPQRNTSYNITMDYSLIKDDVISIFNANEFQGLCGGGSSIINFCVLYGPLPAIKLTLSNDDVTIVLKIENSVSTYFGEHVAIFLEVYYDDLVYFLNYDSGDVDQKILNVWNQIDTMFLYYQENNMLE